jgi:CBS domain-containing protein
MKPMLISEILHSKIGQVVCVSVDASMAEATGLLHKHRIGAVLVMDGDAIAGVLSERDIVRGLHAKGAAVLDHPVRGCMTTPVATVSPRDRVDTALEIMTALRFRHLPVLDDGRLVGVVSIGDLVKHKIEETEREAAELKTYISA